jgi:hypothetical protein
MIFIFNQITSKEKKTFYQMMTPAIYNFKQLQWQLQILPDILLLGLN